MIRKLGIAIVLLVADCTDGAVAGAELRLITCGGVFDRNARSYQDNIIVFAKLS